MKTSSSLVERVKKLVPFQPNRVTITNSCGRNILVVVTSDPNAVKLMQLRGGLATDGGHIELTWQFKNEIPIQSIVMFQSEVIDVSIDGDAAYFTIVA